MKYGYLKRCLCISIAAAVVLGSGPTMLLAEDLLTSGYETDGSLGGDSILSDGTGGSSNGDIVLGSSTEGGGTAGYLGYFAPWDNIVMYYGDFEEYPGLYILGEAVSGAEYIKDIRGEILVESCG